LAGYWGELADWDSGVTIVQKTHDSGAGHVRSFDNGKAVFLMRNPYDAVLSFHNFIYGGHTGFAPSANFLRPGKFKFCLIVSNLIEFNEITEWADFVHHQSRHWLITAMNWTEFSTRLLVVHYETLVEDPVPQLERILRFLQVPIDPQRLECIRVSADFMWPRPQTLKSN
jgi:Sulfotransferase domain